MSVCVTQRECERAGGVCKDAQEYRYHLDVRRKLLKTATSLRGLLYNVIYMLLQFKKLLIC